MVTFRNNNNRRPPFRSNNNRRTPFRRNDEGSKFSNNDHFQRKVPGRNNHNASKLIEKYNDLAREALAQEDKILSENYFQHADHFTRVQNEQESNRVSRLNIPSSDKENSIKTGEVKEATKSVSTEANDAAAKIDVKENTTSASIDVKKASTSTEIKRAIKTTDKKTVEKKTAVS